jgi:hypothetical protein
LRSVTLREERRLKVFENMVLSAIFSPKEEEAAEGWRELHNEKLRNLYSSPHIIRMKLAGYVARMGENINSSNVFIVKSE